jgi:hypothetical protein
MTCPLIPALILALIAARKVAAVILASGKSGIGLSVAKPSHQDPSDGPAIDLIASPFQVTDLRLGPTDLGNVPVQVRPSEATS